jgi:glycosyltransferase involved in cell wall biosynthesis
MPRVLMITENVPVPSDRRVWNEARALRAAGWEVVVVCCQGERRDTEAFELREGIEIHRFPLQPATGGVVGYVREYAQAMWRIRRLVRRLARDRHFDVVHAGNPPDFLLLAARSLKRRGTRLVFDHHDIVPELYQSKFGTSTGLQYRAAVAFERFAFRAADVVVCTNETYRRIAIERGRRSPEDVFVVRNGPDLARFRPAEPDPALKRGRPYLIGYLGIMGPQDGIDHALRALAWLRGRRDDWHAVFVGEGEVLDEMRALARELGIEEHVEFAGWRYDDDIRTILSTCDACLVPDPPSPLNDASTMIKVAEYMAMGKPVVSYDLVESRFSAGAAAVYAAPGDTSDLGAQLDALLSDPQRREQMGAAGRERVRDVLAWEHAVPNLLAAYARAMAVAAAPAPLDAGEREPQHAPA